MSHLDQRAKVTRELFLPTEPIRVDHFSVVNRFPRYSDRREADKGACRISSTPQSSASHHNSAVLVELRSTTGRYFPIHLTRSTKSLQLPSPSASSVMTTVPLTAESSKPEAALMLCAHC